jgi:hypothetical protein
MSDDSFYHNKYLKYKKKYLNLKKMIGGGDTGITMKELIKYAPIAVAAGTALAPIAKKLVKTGIDFLGNEENRKKLKEILPNDIYANINAIKQIGQNVKDNAKGFFEEVINNSGTQKALDIISENSSGLVNTVTKNV